MNEASSIVKDTTSTIITDNITDKSSSLFNDTSNLNSSQSTYNWYGKILFVLLIFALIGINIFGYASLITETISDTFGKPFRQFLGLIGFYTGETVKQTAEMSAEGTKFGADIAKDVVVNTVDTVNDQIVTAQETNNQTDAEIVPVKEDDFDEPPYLDRDELISSFNAVKENRQNEQDKQKNYIEDDAGSTIQNGRNNNGKGWCYVGEDSGFRSCVEVGNGQECMSGDVFPTRDMCINPSLRY